MSRRYIQTTFPPELASGARLGGKFTGPYSGTMAIWKGRPPILSTGDDLEPGTLVISLQGGEVGSTVTVEFEGGNAWGGITKRKFQIGQGLSAELQAGAFAHVTVRATTELFAGQELFFSWTYDPVNRSDLYQYEEYKIDGQDAVASVAKVTVIPTVLATQNIAIAGNDAVGGAAQTIAAVNTGPIAGSGQFAVQSAGGTPLSANQIAQNMVIAINGRTNLAGPGGVIASAVGDQVTITCNTAGAAGNSKTITTSNPATLRIDQLFSAGGGSNSKINLPEGCKAIIPESASNIIFQIPQFGTTFTQSALAGEEIKAIWGAISCNLSQNMIFVLRGV